MATQRENSKQEWKGEGTLNDINAGSLQRIADATEKMAKNYVDLQNNLDSYKKLFEDRGGALDRMYRRNSALRGQITKLRKKNKTRSDEAISYVQSAWVYGSGITPAMTIGDVAKLIKITTGVEVDIKTLTVATQFGKTKFGKEKLKSSKSPKTKNNK
jgi:hypothetical protein